ncbi:antA/AntB antirepressor family protein [Clostridium botulinum]|nr:antA/AntB antirepressor family protein [Clostridium botulinum]
MIKIYKTEDGNSVVDGRELWNGLGVRKEFATWIKNNLQSVDAIEHTDFEVLSFKENNLEGGRPTQEYILTLNIAKEICMVAGASSKANKELKAKWGGFLYLKTKRKSIYKIKSILNEIKSFNRINYH